MPDSSAEVCSGIERVTPRFSIIIPVYNAEKYLRQCIDSVLSQTVSDWECVCVDDGSSDGSGTILDEYAGRDGRFKVIHQTNQGVAATRNAGLDLVEGDWITWLDADDLYAPWRLEELQKIVVEANPDLVRFCTVMGAADVQSPSFSRGASVILEGNNAREWLWNVFLPIGMMWSFAVRKDLFVGLRFVPGMRIKEEFPVCARLAMRVKKVVRSESRAYFYRQLATSAMHTSRRAEDSVCLLGEILKFYQAFPDLPEVARRRLRAHAECEIVDWARQQDGGRAGRRNLFRSYRTLDAAGVFNCPSLSLKRFRGAMWWWRQTGSVRLIVLVAWVECLYRAVSKRKCDIG